MYISGVLTGAGRRTVGVSAEWDEFSKCLHGADKITLTDKVDTRNMGDC